MPVSNTLEFKNILIRAAQENVSDLHLSVGSPISARIDNKLHDWPEQIITEDFLEQNILTFLDEEQKKNFIANGSLMFVYEFADDLRFRITIFKQENKLSAILRYISHKVPTFEEIYLPKIIENILQAERGLILVSGNGKTTTRAVMVDYINRTVKKSIIVLEKIPEYIFNNKKSLVGQRQVGKDTPTFLQGIMDLAHTDTGIVSIGDLDLCESKVLSNVLELSERALVILEMPSNSIKDSLFDFIACFKSDEKQEKRQLVANNMIAVLNQILVARQGGGLLPVMEILLNNNAVATAIAEDRVSRIPDLIVMSGHEGMISRERSLAELVRNGEVLIDEALKYVDDKDEFREMILK
ncbi:MAG: ATPase, T2SS/T4P/T4SS family [Patescibacteria group bacterium]